MTPKNAPASSSPDAQQEGGSALESLTAAVAAFESAQSEALASILAHSAAVGEEVTELAARPTREDLAAVQSQLDASRDDHARESGQLRALVAERDAELSALRTARDKDAETIASLRERFRNFEAAAQDIMAGISIDSLAPAPVDVPGQAEDPAAPAAEAPAAEAVAPEAAESPAEAAPEAAEPAPAVEKPAPAGIILPGLDEDPFDVDQSRAQLLAAAVGTVDPFDLPEHAQADGATFVFNPASADEAGVEVDAPAPAEAAEPPAATAGTVAADPFGFMDIDLPAEDAAPAPAVQEAPKVVPVYI